MDNLIYGNIVKADLDKPLLRLNVGTVMASGDENANRYGAQLHKSGAEVDASSYSVLGYLIRPNDETLKIHGTASGNMVYVDIPQTGYVYDGAFTLTIKVYGDGFEKAVAIFDGLIAKTTTETIVDGDRVVYGVEEILAQIDAMEKAEADALAAAEKATEAASKAPYVGSNGNWYVWDAEANAYKDSGTKATGADGEDGQNGQDGIDGITPNITFTASTGEPGSDVQISQSGTAENPVVNLTIPRGTPGSGSVSSVNGVAPDANGNVEIDAGGGTVQSVNGAFPDENGNVTIDVGGDVQSVDSIAPDDNGNVAIGAVRYSAAQELTDEQKAQVLSNLGLDVGISGGVEMKVVWENESPTSEFAAQTVNIVGATGYDYMIIMAKVNTSATARTIAPVIAKVGDIGRIMGMYFSGIAFREFTIESHSAVTFDDGKVAKTYSASNNDGLTAYASSVIPIRIIAIKGVTSL